MPVSLPIANNETSTTFGDLAILSKLLGRSSPCRRRSPVIELRSKLRGLKLITRGPKSNSCCHLSTLHHFVRSLV
ncbi:hypothetical protein WG66_009179 [Moniliophthora roreri]|nr:hypothetical protein WG66_009179 [Moniliophthora roreri]